MTNEIPSELASNARIVLLTKYLAGAAFRRRANSSFIFGHFSSVFTSGRWLGDGDIICRMISSKLLDITATRDDNNG